jgi:hypothetical protein
MISSIDTDNRYAFLNLPAAKFRCDFFRVRGAQPELQIFGERACGLTIEDPYFL